MSWTCPDDCGHDEYMHTSLGCFHKNGHDIYCSCQRVPTVILFQMRAELVARNSCQKHKRYKAIRKPRTLCEGCWRLWVKTADLIRP